MDKRAVVERVMNSHSYDIRLAVARGRIVDVTVELILEAAGYFEIVEAAREACIAIDSQKNPKMSIYAKVKHKNLKDALKKAGVLG